MEWSRRGCLADWTDGIWIRLCYAQRFWLTNLPSISAHTPFYLLTLAISVHFHLAHPSCRLAQGPETNDVGPLQVAKVQSGVRVDGSGLRGLQGKQKNSCPVRRRPQVRHPEQLHSDSVGRFAIRRPPMALGTPARPLGRLQPRQSLLTVESPTSASTSSYGPSRVSNQQVLNIFAHSPSFPHLRRAPT